MASDRMFPIQGEYPEPSGSVPWWVAERAYRRYTEVHGTEQSLERLAERGGFGWAELIDLLLGGRGDGRAL